MSNETTPDYLHDAKTQNNDQEEKYDVDFSKYPKKELRRFRRELFEQRRDLIRRLMEADKGKKRARYNKDRPEMLRHQQERNRIFKDLKPTDYYLKELKNNLIFYNSTAINYCI